VRRTGALAAAATAASLCAGLATAGVAVTDAARAQSLILEVLGLCAEPPPPAAARFLRRRGDATSPARAGQRAGIQIVQVQAAADEAFEGVALP
jgi:hypothetical protein